LKPSFPCSQRSAITSYPAYLWGIETWTPNASPLGRCSYPAYLWGIETVDDGRLALDRSGIQPTYEELKHKCL